jgi:ribonucleoside-diphosphate reductase alpha chain
MFTEEQIEFLRQKNYLVGDETIEQRVDSIVGVVKNYEKDYSEGLGERVRELILNKILSLSTPQIANLGRDTGELPCSCNIVGVNNSISGIYYAHGEEAMLSKLGAGVGVDYTHVFDKGTKLEEGFYSNPKLDWIEDSIAVGQKVSQSSKRRGYVVPFISIDDKEFYDVLERASKKNTDKTDPLTSNNIGIVLPIGFKERLRGKDKEAQKRFLKVLQERKDEGKIYILDVENANKNQSPVYDSLQHVVNQTNICTEALSPYYSDKTFACILSSLNLIHWDTIKENPQIIKDSIMFLDIVVEEYIRLTDGVPFLEKANRSAREKRDIGLGTLGLAELFQARGYAFGDVQSRLLNRQIYSFIQRYAVEASEELAKKLGPAPMCKEARVNRRNVSLQMIAPNKSTSFLMGTSEGIEPFRSNYTVLALAGIQSVFKNPHLKKVLQEQGKDTLEVWEYIRENLGSVQHLDFLTDAQKKVFMTALEVSPKDIIDMAASRQPYIDMGQSLNLFNRPNYSLKDIYDLHMYALDRGIKSLYYFYPSSHAVLEKDGANWNSCVSCAD